MGSKESLSPSRPSINSAELSRSAATGRKSGWSQILSRRSAPTATVTRRHSSKASLTFGVANSIPTTFEKACSAEPPVARRRRQAWFMATVEGMRLLSASVTTYSTQPSISASSVSKRDVALALRDEMRGEKSISCSWAIMSCS